MAALVVTRVRRAWCIALLRRLCVGAWVHMRACVRACVLVLRTYTCGSFEPAICNRGLESIKLCNNRLKKFPEFSQWKSLRSLDARSDSTGDVFAKNRVGMVLPSACDATDSILRGMVLVMVLHVCPNCATHTPLHCHKAA